MQHLLAACLALGFVACVPPAFAQQIESREGIQLRDQILELRQEVQSLRDSAGRGGSSLGGAQSAPVAVAPSDITAQLLDRVQRLEDAIRMLNGRIDELNNARQRGQDDLAKQIGDLNFKLDSMAGGAPAGSSPNVAPAANPPVAGAGPAQLSPPPGNLGGSGDFGPAPSGTPPVPPVPPPLPPLKRTAETILRDGNTALARRDFSGAEAAAREVLAQPKSPRASDAQFLLAQSLAGRKDYSGAAVAYDDSYTRSRTGAHAPDALLGLANSLSAINERKAACETLDKLRAEFPALRTDLKDPAALARKNAGCR